MSGRLLLVLVLYLNLAFCLLPVKMEDLDLPEIKRRKVQEKKAEDKKEFKDLFESDSDSDDDDGLKVKGEPSLSPRLQASPRLFLIRRQDAAAAWPLGGRVSSRTKTNLHRRNHS